MERPEEVKWSRKDGEVLIERLKGDALTAHDRRVLEQVLRWYFWLLFALQEARFSLKRLRAMVFGDRAKTRTQKPSSGGISYSGGGAGGPGAAPAEAPVSQAAAEQPHPGHGRQGAEAYVGAERVMCHHEELVGGERCPVCGRGRLYRVEPGVEVRLNGHALLSAVRYALEKLRCSACGQVFTASLPEGVGQEKAHIGFQGRGI